MENNEYLNEERYRNTNNKVKSIGKILLISGAVTLVIGILLLVLGFIGFGNTASSSFNSINNNTFDSSIVGTAASSTFKNFGLFLVGGFFESIGSILIIAGAIMLFISHKREIAAYTIQQTMPIAQEGINKITPTIANSAGTIAESISKGIQKGKNNDEK